MVVLSTLLLFPDSAERMNGKYWLAGLSLWFLGFASMVGWLLLRWSVRQSKDGPPPLLVWSVRPCKRGESPPTQTEATAEMRRPHSIA
jgi:hypothetical protein